MENTCPHCGKPVTESALGGLCPECMLDVGAAAPTADASVPPGTPPTPTPSPEDLAPHFPQLEILECLGRGGMGAVYKARQPRLDRMVALKILLPRPGTGTTEPGFTERFQREARALAQLSHPNIVGVHDFGESGGYPFLVMEYVDGLNLRQMQQEEKLSPEQALAIVPDVCEALQYAHERGVIHRDIKPENILIDTAGQVKIADFGIAKVLRQPADEKTLTRERDVMGTPHYMAPEQVEQPLKVDHRADIYSLGVVFYEMLTGELPLGRFPLPSRKVKVDVRLDEIVLHTLEKEPERRYQHAGDVKTDVVSIASSPPAGPSPADAPAALGKRTSLLLYGLVVSVIGLPFGVGLGLPLVVGLSLAGIIVSLLKLSGRLAILSPLSGEAYPGLRAVQPREERQFSGLQMVMLGLGCGCCVAGIAFGVNVRGGLLSPVLVVLGMVGVAVIVPSMVLGRPVLGTRHQVSPSPSAPPPVSAARRPGRGPLYWILVSLLGGIGVLLVLAVGAVLLTRALTAVSQARRAATPPVQVIDTEPASADLGPLVWGPVYKATLAGQGHEARRFLDLDTSEAHASAEFSASEDVSMDPDETRQWGKDTGIDLVPNLQGSGSVLGLDLVAVPVTQETWDNLGPDLPRSLEVAVPEPLSMLPYDPDTPATFAFRTREGTIGMLRLTEADLTPGRSSITVQYRLTVSPAAAGLEMAAPVPTPLEAAPRPTGIGVRRQGREATMAQLASLEAAVESYRVDTGTYPGTQEGLAVLGADPGVDNWNGPYLKSDPHAVIDPWGTPIRYTSEGSDIELRSAGPDRTFDTPDDL